MQRYSSMRTILSMKIYTSPHLLPPLSIFVTQVTSPRIFPQTLFLSFLFKVFQVQVFSLVLSFFQQIQIPVQVPKQIKVFFCFFIYLYLFIYFLQFFVCVYSIFYQKMIHTMIHLLRCPISGEETHTHIN